MAGPETLPYTIFVETVSCGHAQLQGRLGNCSIAGHIVAPKKTGVLWARRKGRMDIWKEPAESAAASLRGREDLKRPQNLFPALVYEGLNPKAIEFSRCFSPTRSFLQL